MVWRTGWWVTVVYDSDEWVGSHELREVGRVSDGKRTELAVGKSVVLRAGWQADMRMDRWTVEQAG